jgi:Tfp pilus assembly protein PilN
MIRINLIEGSQKRARAARTSDDAFSAPSSPPAVKIGIGFAILAVAGVFGHYTLLQRESSNLQADLDKEQHEAQRLANVQQEFNENSERKQMLMHRIAIIDDLKNNQSGPSSLLRVMADTVLNAHSVWLTTMKEKGTEIDLEGSALNMDSVANLISQMLLSGYFQSVDLNETLEQSNGALLHNPFNFKLVAQIGAPQTPGAANAAAPAGGNPAGTRPASAPQPASQPRGTARS